MLPLPVLQHRGRLFYFTLLVKATARPRIRTASDIVILEEVIREVKKELDRFHEIIFRDIFFIWIYVVKVRIDSPNGTLEIQVLSFRD